DRIIAALKRGRLVPILGLDVNLYGRELRNQWRPGVVLPCSRELTAYLAERFDYDDRRPQLACVSQFAFFKEGKKLGPLYEELSEAFAPPNGDPSPLYGFLALLQRVVTENLRDNSEDDDFRRFVLVTSTYDDMAETAFASHAREFHVISYQPAKGRFFHKIVLNGRMIGQPLEVTDCTYQ